MRSVEESAGTYINDAYEPTERMMVNCMVRGSKLILTWTYSSLHYEMETIQQLVNTYLQNLKELIRHCIVAAQSGSEYTPSDYGLGKELTSTELDAFLNSHNSEMTNIIEF